MTDTRSTRTHLTEHNDAHYRGAQTRCDAALRVARNGISAPKPSPDAYTDTHKNVAYTSAKR